MLVGRHGRKFIALFFLVFFGLNFAGVLCLSHCKDIGNFIKGQLIARSVENHSAGHCDKQKASERSSGHHRSAEQKGDIADAGHSISGIDNCCDFTAAMIAAPFKTGLELYSPTAVISENIALPRRDETAVIYRHDQTPLVYRPPPLDRSDTLILNCIIRI